MLIFFLFLQLFNFEKLEIINKQNGQQAMMLYPKLTVTFLKTNIIFSTGANFKIINITNKDTECYISALDIKNNLPVEIKVLNLYRKYYRLTVEYSNFKFIYHARI